MGIKRKKFLKTQYILYCKCFIFLFFSSISPAKPILKSTEKEGSVPRKSVRFSLRPGNITTTTKTETELITPDPAVDNSSTISGDLTENFDNVHENEDIAEAISEVNETSPRELDVDKTVEEFSKVVEEEEKVLHDQTTPTVKKSRKGRLIGIFENIFTTLFSDGFFVDKFVLFNLFLALFLVSICKYYARLE